MEELRSYKSDVYCVGECWSGEAEVVEYGKALNCFNFTAAQAEGVIAAAAKGGDLAPYTGYVAAYQDKIRSAHPDGMPIFFLSNHDMDRSAGYLTMANGFPYMGCNLLLLTPGSPYIYYGEEIGMKGSRGSANTDANRRLAMLWGDGDTVRDPEGTTYDKGKQTNGTVAEQLDNGSSLMNHYRRIISLRVKYPAIGRGEYTPLSLGHAKVGGFLVEYEGKTIAIIHNVDRENPLTVDLAKSPVPLGELLEIVGIAEDNAAVEDGRLTIGPQTTVIMAAGEGF